MIVGLAATALGCLAFAAGFLDRLYWFGYDLHCRWFSTIPADPRIAMIDVDDQTLQAIPWPWERRTFAQLVDTLHELGAKAIVLDFIFDEPRKPRREIFDSNDDDSELPVYGDPNDAPIIHDDDELRDAMANRKNVYLPMYAPRKAVGGDRDPYAKPAFEFLQEQPDASFRQFFKATLSGQDIDAITVQRAELVRTYRRAKALVAIAPAEARDSMPTALIEAPTLPLALFGSVAKGVGFAAFDRGMSEGVLRTMKPIVEWNNRRFFQLGLLVGTIENCTQDAFGNMKLNPRSTHHVVTSMLNGDIPVLWNRPRRMDRWQESFLHIPATQILEIAADRQAIHDNEMRVRILRDELVRVRHADTHATYIEYVQLIRAREEIGKTPENVPNRSDHIKEIEDEAQSWLSRTWHLWEQTSPMNAEEVKDRNRIQRLYKAFSDGNMAAKAEEINSRLAKRIDELSSELRPQIDGKLCFVGYTASAVADLVTTPVYSAMPGVIAHANLCNMVLQNRFLRVAPFSINFAMFAIGGLATLFLGVTGSWRRSVIGAIALIGVVAAVGAILFAKADFHLASSVAVAQIGFVWTGVTIYRQGVEERVRRRLHRALAQYTSPEVADGIIDRVSAGDLAPQSAMVTCFFCDLTGFTRLSERIGPEKTRDVLNPYLNTVSRILVKHGAIVNKFMGDGIFAFFNAPIRPCPDHAEAACRAAIEIAREIQGSKFEEQREAKRQQGKEATKQGFAMTRSEPGVQAAGPSIGNRKLEIGNSPAIENGVSSEDAFPLAIRIGLATGEAFVGDYGSETKLDYTCIGDTANLASRLEQLNKKFSTTILVDSATHSACHKIGLTFVERGTLEIEGREKSAFVFELIVDQAKN